MTTSTADSPGIATSTAQPFVINLCSSTSPMALAHPSAPELKRYTFFVSRQREDGRERFRLHMGYFNTQESAEQLLAAVRDVYPAAWAGPAPTQGVARRGRISPVQLAPAVAQAASAAVTPPAASPVVRAAPAVATASVAQKADEARPLDQTMSEMRSVLAQLGDDATTVVAPTVEMPQPPPPAVQSGRPVEPPRLHPVSQPKVATPATASDLTPAQTLKVLEPDSAEGEPKVRVLTPEDTQTLTDIKLDKDNNAPPCFAVQLVWSVTPIDVSAMPHMAIFDAYTLYNVEGNRQGRKWYGLRLGFFSDPNSATQVANYVRGDYRSVAVVPVASKEKDRAGGGTAASPADSAINPPLKASDQLSTNRETMDGFELVPDDSSLPKKRDLDSPRDPAVVAAAIRAKLAKTLGTVPTVQAKESTPRVPGKATGKPNGKRVVVRRKPDTRVQGAPGTAAVLESTLDILGASTLTLDEGGSMALDEAAARPRASKKPANGKFSKLLSRLGGG